MRWLNKLGRFGLHNFDLLSAIGVALVFTYLGARDQVSAETLTKAAIGLLAVLSIGILHERLERAKAVEGIDRAVESVSRARPWEILDERLEWDIRSRQSATCLSERDIRFLAPEIFAIHEFERGTTGSVSQRLAAGAARGDALRPLRILEPGILGPEGRTYHVICLESAFHGGDRMSLRYERQLTNSFLADRENVSKLVQSETGRLVMRVAWPPTNKPSSVRLERTSGHNETLHPKTREGRATVEVTIDNPPIGEVVDIVWTW